MLQQRYLGSTGLKVSELALGALTFGSDSDEELSHQILDRFVEAGGTLIDTANVYSRGLSEEILGRWLAGRNRDDVVIATKVRWSMGDGPHHEGLSRKHILASVEASLRRLGTDYIDVYQTHGWDPHVPLEETLSTLDGLVKSGKVRYIGLSNVRGWQLQKAIDVAERHGWERLASLQPCYSLLVRETEWELLPVCRHEGLGVLPWSPLASGWLSGKFRRGMTEPPPNSRIAEAEKRGLGENWEAYATERTWTVLDALHKVAAESGRTPAQVALNWLLDQPGVTAPILGARTLEQLDENLAAAGWSLDPAHRTILDTASALDPLPYPYFFIPN